jgi:hypothetical protein
VPVTKDYVGHKNSQGRTTKKNKQMEEFINMEIINENSSNDTGTKNSRKIGGMLLEIDNKVPNDLKEGILSWYY